MPLRRVVITGVGVVTPIGYTVPELLAGLASGASGVRPMPGWENAAGLNCRVGAPVELRQERVIPRQHRRTMSRMSVFAAQAAVEALTDAGLELATLQGSPRTGCVLGSTTGSPEAMMEAYQTLLSTRDISMLTSTKCFQCFSHTVTMNVFQYLGLRGTVLATSAACASGLQAVGVGYDLVRLGRQDLVLCGGAEELHETVTGSFDILAATSTGYNRLPEATPRPFDRQRDGLVCGEGAGVVVLEDRERALARGARLHGEILGYHTCGSSFHVSQSDHSAIAACILGALRDADVPAGQVDYISAHATGTIQGDAAEARAIREIFGARPPVSSLKGHLGHTLAASGAIELVAALRMMAHGIVYPTRNLEQVGPDCDGIGHVQRARPLQIRCFLKNCFAFGGINAALVCGQA